MFRLQRWVAIFTVVLGVTFGAVHAQEPIKLGGKINIGVHEVTMKEGTIYLIKVEGKDFRPQVQMDPGYISYLDQGFDNTKPVQGYYYAERNQIHTLYIVPDSFSLRGKKGPFEYNMTVTPLILAAKPSFTMDDTLANNDPAYANQFVKKEHHKAYEVKMSPGQFYCIDMVRRGDNRLDCYLFLEDGDGKIVASNDDGGGMLNSRIIYTPQKAGTHRIIATNLGSNVGDFTVSVRTQEKE